MSGIYFHIPFCIKKCSYCDFYSKNELSIVDWLVKAEIQELKLRSNYLDNEIVDSIYFGGGTPSLLNIKNIQELINCVRSEYLVSDKCEITFEANPDDLTPEYLTSIKKLPFNRISIGIQSFDDEDLKRINRRHTGEEAITAVRNAQSAGFNNLSIDLIYGLPFQTLEAWENQLDIALSLNVQHISSYGLTYEEGTALWKQREKGKVTNVDDEVMNAMYLLLLERVKQKGFEAYEVSNFALVGRRSRHNTSYWKQEPYLGIGPSAHSYDLVSRQWNVSSIKDYIKAFEIIGDFFEREELTLFDRYNDFVMVSLRTSDGLDKATMKNEFGLELAEYCLRNVQSFIQNGKVSDSNGKLRLTPDGIMISNIILIELMKV